MLNFKLSQTGYVLINSKIEKYTYSEFLREFGSDETTTPNGIAPRLYVDRNTIMTYGVRGNNHKFYASFKNKTEAKKVLFEIWEQNLSELCEFREFFKTKKDLIKDFSENTSQTIKEVILFFKDKEKKALDLQVSKIKYDNRPSFTKEMMIEFIKNNREMVSNSIAELDELKAAENKEVWQVKANTLIQKVSNNDFRVLNWKEIYNLIKNN